MNKVCIYGHTVGAVLKKLYFTELQYNKEVEKKSRKARRMRRLRIEPKLRQVKVGFTRSCVTLSVYRPVDFEFKKVMASTKIKFRDIDRVEVRIYGNNNPSEYFKVYKVKFFNELNEEIFYLNFGSTNEFYAYKESLKGYHLLMSLIQVNNIEYDIIDETFFK